VVKGATEDVAVARKAYDKQKVIVKSREVDEAALVIILIDFSPFMLH
jgi:hypothetical protein